MVFKKVNIKEILKSHFSTLQNDNSKKSEFDDYFTFLILPLIISTVLLYFKISLRDSAVNIIITTLSILVGLLFNVIVLIFDIIKRDASQKIKNTVLKQLLANISFTILLSIVTILFTLTTYLDVEIIKNITTWIVYFLLTNFLLTVLMILKRMYKLFENEIVEIEKSQNESEKS